MTLKGFTGSSKPSLGFASLGCVYTHPRQEWNKNGT
jgi:hypothetical protein